MEIQTAPVFEPLLAPARYKGAHGGRGSGKSWFFAELLVEHCLLNPGTHAVCIREIQKSLAQSAKRIIEIKIQAMGVGCYFDVQRDAILTPGGGRIIFQGMQNHTAESIKSLEGYDIAWVEEAQTLSQTSLSMLTPTLRKRGSEIWFSWNPAKAKDPVDQLLRGDEPPPDAAVIQVNWYDNPWFDETELPAEREYDLRRNPDRYKHKWEGAYQRNTDAQVFRNWRKDVFEAPAGVKFYLGADWGMRVDPSVLVRCYIVGRELFVDYEAYQVGCPLDKRPALFDRVPNARNFQITADGSWPDTLDAMRKFFPRMMPAVKGPGSVVEGVEFLQQYDIVVHERCIHVIEELENYSFVVDKKTDEITNVLEDKKNHTIDSLRYALEGVRRQNVVKSEELRI